jgi:hypothetical protein
MKNKRHDDLHKEATKIAKKYQIFFWGEVQLLGNSNFKKSLKGIAQRD